MCYHIFEVLLPYEFLLEQNPTNEYNAMAVVLLPYEFLLEQNFKSTIGDPNEVLLPYEFLLEQNQLIQQ